MNFPKPVAVALCVLGRKEILPSMDVEKFAPTP